MLKRQKRFKKNETFDVSQFNPDENHHEDTTSETEMTRAPTIVISNPVHDASSIPDLSNTNKILKNTIFKLSSLPMTSTNNKREVFEKALEEDDVLNKYIENQLNTYLRFQNEHVNALIHYSYHYANVKNSTT